MKEEERMDRKRLIFFTSKDPGVDPGPAWSAYHFAGVAAKAGLEAEVRLAGDAVLVAKSERVQVSPKGEELVRKAKDGSAGAFLVSL
jgi:hypothetical protein